GPLGWACPCNLRWPVPCNNWFGRFHWSDAESSCAPFSVVAVRERVEHLGASAGLETGWPELPLHFKNLDGAVLAAGRRQPTLRGVGHRPHPPLLAGVFRQQ